MDGYIACLVVHLQLSGLFVERVRELKNEVQEEKSYMSNVEVERVLKSKALGKRVTQAGFPLLTFGFSNESVLHE